MMRRDQVAMQLVRAALIVIACAAYCLGGDAPNSGNAEKLHGLLHRTGEQMSDYLGKFSDVRCTERVIQEKFKNNGKDKIDLREESTYDYLVILSNSSGELSLSESRLPVDK